VSGFWWRLVAAQARSSDPEHFPACRVLCLLQHTAYALILLFFSLALQRQAEAAEAAAAAEAAEAAAQQAAIEAAYVDSIPEELKGKVQAALQRELVRVPAVFDQVPACGRQGGWLLPGRQPPRGRPGSRAGLIAVCRPCCARPWRSSSVSSSRSCWAE